MQHIHLLCAQHESAPARKQPRCTGSRQPKSECAGLMEGKCAWVCCRVFSTRCKPHCQRAPAERLQGVALALAAGVPHARHVHGVAVEPRRLQRLPVCQPRIAQHVAVEAVVVPHLRAHVHMHLFLYMRQACCSQRPPSAEACVDSKLQLKKKVLHVDAMCLPHLVHAVVLPEGPERLPDGIYCGLRTLRARIDKSKYHKAKH